MLTSSKSLLLCGASAALALTAASANAQTRSPARLIHPTAKPEGRRSPTQVGEVVVTGTQLRGVAPVGTDVIGVSRADIITTGVTSTDGLLATIPVVTSQFNTVPTVGTTIGISTIRPNIRNIGAAGGTTTLVLMDGHNLVGAGVLQTTPDAGVIPPGALERVEVVADGGSALYGSDAVGGIINFITRKHMEGVEFGPTPTDVYANNYSTKRGQSPLSATRWGSGSALLSYDYRQNTDLLDANRSYLPPEPHRPEAAATSVAGPATPAPRDRRRRDLRPARPRRKHCRTPATPTSTTTWCPKSTRTACSPR